MTDNLMPQMIVDESHYWINSYPSSIDEHAWIERRYVIRKPDGSDVYQFTAKIQSLSSELIVGEAFTADPQKNVLDDDGRTIVNNKAIALAHESLKKQIKRVVELKSV